MRFWGSLAGLVLLVTGPVMAQDSSVLEASQRDFVERFLDATQPARSTVSQREIAADFLIAELERRGLVAERRPYLEPNVHPILDLIMPPFSGTNITASIPATRDEASLIVLGAHYDSEAGSPGADDNASGIAALISIAVNLSRMPERRYSVMLAFFDQEEEGKVGSQALVRQLLADKIDIHSMHSIDMAGWDSDGDGAIEIDAPDIWFARYQNAATRLEIPVSRASYDSTDHVSFRAHGIDAICLSEAFRAGDSSPHRHRSSDMAETLNHAYLAANTELMLAVLRDTLSGAAE